MSELTLFLLQLAFLGLLWAFVFAIVYALRTDLFGPPRYRQEEDDKPTAKYSPDQPPTLSPAP
ncbi:MAG: FHA domain-containing protein, partial [Pontimonas sp.]|nr:FHA domain-containing protein [Pontimonas sp.]